MVNQTEQVTKFLGAVAGAAPDEAAALLVAAPEFMALNVALSGADAVMARFFNEDTARVYSQVAWQTPESWEGAVRIKGLMPEGSPSGGVLMVFHFDGDRIATIQQQGLPGAPWPASELKLTDGIKTLVNAALASRNPMMIAYTDEAGQPNLSFRGSTLALSDNQLAIWVRNAQGQMIRSIAKNPKVALMYRDEDSKSTYQFKGTARLSSDEAIRREVYAAMPKVERDHDFARTGVVMVIDLDSVEGFAGLSPKGPVGRVRMLR